MEVADAVAVAVAVVMEVADAVAVAGGAADVSDQDPANAGAMIAGKVTEEALLVVENGDCLPPASAGSDEPDSQDATDNVRSGPAPAEDSKMADPDSQDATSIEILLAESIQIQRIINGPPSKENHGGEEMDMNRDNPLDSQEEGDESRLEIQRGDESREDGYEEDDESHLEIQRGDESHAGEEAADASVTDLESQSGDEEQHSASLVLENGHTNLEGDGAGIEVVEEGGGEFHGDEEQHSAAELVENGHPNLKGDDNGIKVNEGGGEFHDDKEQHSAAFVSENDDGIEVVEEGCGEFHGDEEQHAAALISENSHANLEGKADGIEVVEETNGIEVIDACNDEGQVERDDQAKDPEIKFVLPTEVNTTEMKESEIEESIETSPSVAAGTSIDSTNVVPELEGKPDASALRQPGNPMSGYMVVLPRVFDRALQEELQHKKEEKDKNVKIRDSFTIRLRKQKAIVRELQEKLTIARADEREARDAFKAKHQELNELYMGNEIDEIAEQIRSMEHSLQHDTMPLNKEKQLIKEMGKLKQRHSSLRVTLGQKALEPKDQSEEGLQVVLTKEIENLRNQLTVAQHKTKDARSEHDAEFQHIDDLQKSHNEAHDLQQLQYEQIKEIKKILQEKNKYYYDFKSDYEAAIRYKRAGDKEGFENHCTRQVENFMDLWNNNKDFREQYIKCQEAKARGNRGRNAEPCVIPGSEEKQPSVVVPSSTADDPVRSSETSAGSSDHSTSKENDPPFKAVKRKSKKSTKPTSIDFIAILSAEEVEKPEADDHYMSKEEEELARKEEETRKEKAVAELKEKLRLEEIVKAKEAEDRKRRNAEKAKVKAEYKAQKETEEKEKKKAKKEKKKERKNKKKLMAGQTSGDDEKQDDAPIAEVNPPETNPPEIARDTKPSTARTSKKSGKLKPSFKKPTTVQPLPLPLRRRPRRRIQIWMMWVLAVAAIVLTLFAAGNYISTSTFAKLEHFAGNYISTFTFAKLGTLLRIYPRT